MCGIAGIALRDSKAFPNTDMLLRMANRIQHRGPDGEGIYISAGCGLVHRRLSIIDLGDTGVQPMHSAAGFLIISFNGEIYNYRELRTELEVLGRRFYSTSDTEVILEGYAEWGVSVFSKLRGMFAIALWNTQADTLILARDINGKKPLYYAECANGDIVFGSEIKTFQDVVPFAIDENAIRLYFGLQYVPTPMTGFTGIKQLEAGQYAIIHAGKIEKAKYHEYTKTTVFDLASDADRILRIRELLQSAVSKRQLASDVPVGAFLSGGIDSSAVVAFASKLKMGEPLHTFCMGFDETRYDERAQARETAKYFGTTHHEFKAHPEDLLKLLDILVSHYDMPYADSSALPVWLLAEQTSKYIKVVLTGDGGDELFGGYSRYIAYEQAQKMLRWKRLPRILHSMGQLFRDTRFHKQAKLIETMRDNPPHAYAELFCSSYFSSEAQSHILQKDFLYATSEYSSVDFIVHKMGGDTSLASALFFDLTSYLPDDLNVKMDRATMRFGLEARSPFQDQDLVEYALALPASCKVKGRNTKIILKKALEGIVPSPILKRKKRGFQVPLASWFRGPLKKTLEERCLPASCRLSAYVKPEMIRHLIQENDAGYDHGNRLWMLLSLATWLQNVPK